jgi:hypothetical protein
MEVSNPFQSQQLHPQRISGSRCLRGCVVAESIQTLWRRTKTLAPHMHHWRIAQWLPVAVQGFQTRNSCGKGSLSTLQNPVLVTQLPDGNTEPTALNQTSVKINHKRKLTIKVPETELRLINLQSYSTNRRSSLIIADGRNSYVLFSIPKPFRLALGPTQPPIQWVPGFFSGARAAASWSWPLTSI